MSQFIEGLTAQRIDGNHGGVEGRSRSRAVQAAHYWQFTSNKGYITTIKLIELPYFSNFTDNAPPDGVILLRIADRLKTL